MGRTTVMEKDGEQITIRTDESGTQVMDENGSVITTYGSDRHQEEVDSRSQGGWVIVSNT